MNIGRRVWSSFFYLMIIDSTNICAEFNATFPPSSFGDNHHATKNSSIKKKSGCKILFFSVTAGAPEPHPLQKHGLLIKSKTCPDTQVLETKFGPKKGPFFAGKSFSPDLKVVVGRVLKSQNFKIASSWAGTFSKLILQRYVRSGGGLGSQAVIEITIFFSYLRNYWEEKSH
jgi:hypothetical protein